MGYVRALWNRVRPPRQLIVSQKHLLSPYSVVWALTYPHAARATGASYRGTMTPAIGRKMAIARESHNISPTILELAIVA